MEAERKRIVTLNRSSGIRAKSKFKGLPVDEWKAMHPNASLADQLVKVIDYPGRA